MQTIETDVLVVGAGPAGLTAAAFLAKHGVDALTVTRYSGTANSPRAHITNQRTIEVFRDLGIEDRIRAAAVPNELMGNNVWATSFAGQELARLKTWGTGTHRHADYTAASPSAMCNIPQHILEPLILEAANEYGAQVRFSTEVVEITQDAGHVHAVVRERTTDTEYRIRAKYAIGADGGRSTVAQQLEFPLRGEMGLGAAMNIWLEADLTQYTAYRPGTLYWMAQPGNDYWVGSGTWICVKPWTEWVLLCMYNPEDGEPDTSEASVIERARATIGDDSIDIRIKAVSKWQINHVIADTYQKGRVFLAGDAAHRHPPANGLGTNTSVQDAFNLAWKLAFVLRGHAGPTLLDSYTQERQPVGQQVVDRAMQSVRDMLPISEALGFRPGQSAEEGWDTVHELFSDTDAGRRRRTGLDDAVQLQNYQFNAHGIELGQRYHSSSVVDDGTPFPPPVRDPELYYQPSTHPGARLPHAWLEHHTRQVSTLDLTGHGRLSLLVGEGGQPWRAAADKLASELGIELPVVSLGVGCEYNDVLREWTAVREISDGGALLVRPDHHIAWRSPDLPEIPLEALRTALSSVLH
ncbi:FAD-dependent monooxygenase [Rhodococcus opacus]|uniref:FAD-dependent monooxygenase n=1 Tax=Rhodococcus opacus TaxID=37919 RepID=UPI00247443EA|nr:FAD-dependent monooxygenase [Rhodococcus opacus]MDH6292467.1 2,4-dichlorophenol 6-monooxygenase [Rhodococcus opacus]